MDEPMGGWTKLWVGEQVDDWVYEWIYKVRKMKKMDGLTLSGQYPTS